MYSKKKIMTLFITTLFLFGYSIYYYNKIDGRVLFIATTTSVENSGLLDLIIPDFEKQYNIILKVTARGSGASVDLAKRGEVDAILIHAPTLEDELIKEGYATNKTVLWFNFFAIIGPVDDPANIKNASSLSEAMSRINNAGDQGLLKFYSRGDESGTHLKEKQLWENSSIIPPTIENSWYFETGSGMAATIRIAEENTGYTLSDMGTFLQLKENLGLETSVLYDTGELLFNPYSYIIINNVKFPNLNTKDAILFLEYLKSPSTKSLVQSYTMLETVLFTPMP